MASITANSLRSGKRAKDAQGSDQHLSKVVELNGKYRIFFRTWPTEDGLVDIAAAMVPGRSCNFDICGTGFIPYTKDMYSIDETHQIDDNTGLRCRIVRQNDPVRLDKCLLHFIIRYIIIIEVNIWQIPELISNFCHL